MYLSCSMQLKSIKDTEVVTVSLTADLLIGLTARDNLFIIAGGKVQMHHFVKSTSCKREA